MMKINVNSLVLLTFKKNNAVLYLFPNVFCRIKFKLPTAVTGLIIYYCLSSFLCINFHFPAGLNLDIFSGSESMENHKKRFGTRTAPKSKSSA